MGDFNAWNLVASWAEERAKDAANTANAAEAAYTKPSKLAAACAEYASGMRGVAGQLTLLAQRLRARASQQPESEEP